MNKNEQLSVENNNLENKLKENELEILSLKRKHKSEILNLNSSLKNLNKLKETFESNNSRLQHEVDDYQDVYAKLKDNSNNGLIKMLEEENGRLTIEVNQSKELLNKERVRSNSELEKLKQIYEIRVNRLASEKESFKKEYDRIMIENGDLEIETEKYKSIKNVYIIYNIK